MFEDVQLKWNGQSYNIRSHRIVGAVARVEDHLTLFELLRYNEQSGAVPFGKLSGAYEAALKYAGCQVKPGEVYVYLMNNVTNAAAITEIVTSMLMIMVPPNMRETEGGGTAPANPPKAVTPATRAKPSSRKRTRR